MLGVVNRVSGPRDVVVCAAGSMPGDLHKLWRTRDPKGYHVEYGFSCMGYEIAGGLGVKLAAPDREVYVMVGDGSFLMMAQEIVTAVQEEIKLTIVLVQNHGFASIGALSESLGSQRFGTRYRGRDGEVLPVDLARGRGGPRRRRPPREPRSSEFEAALREAAASPRITVVEVQTDPLVGAPDSEAWWDVPVAEVAGARVHPRGARDVRAEQAHAAGVRHMSVGVGVIGAGMMGAAHVAHAHRRPWRARTSPPSPTRTRRARPRPRARAARGRSPTRTS